MYDWIVKGQDIMWSTENDFVSWCISIFPESEAKSYTYSNSSLLKDAQRAIEIPFPLPRIMDPAPRLFWKTDTNELLVSKNYSTNVKKNINYLKICGVMVLTINPPGDSVAGAAMAMFPGADAPAQPDVADAAPKAKSHGLSCTEDGEWFTPSTSGHNGDDL